MTMDARTFKFRKIFNPKITKKEIIHSKDAITHTIAHITGPAKEKFGFPLKRFPTLKFDHYQLEPIKDEKQIDYSVDEFDMKWMTLMNKNQCRLGRDYFSVAILEHWFDRLEKFCIWKPKEHHKLRDEHGEEVDDVCNICLDGDTSNCNQIIYCDRCNLAVHQDCYGIPFIPEGCLECRRCAFSPARVVHCVLCPSTTGAFKQMDNKQWVHVLCVIWVDETHFGNTIFMENVQNVEKAINDRKALICQLCKNRKHARMGACIQCSESKCTASFHVTCARNAGLTMRIVEKDNGQVNRFAWCVKHTPVQTEADREQQKLRLRNEQRENERKLPVISMPTLTTAIIANIRAEEPFSEYRDIIYFWYQRRQNRLGAPLMKNYLQNDEDVDVTLSPESPKKSRRRSLRGAGASSLKNFDEISQQIKEMEKLFTSSISMFDMILQREEKKRDLIKMSMEMLQRGFKPVSHVIPTVIDQLKKIDKGKVFAEPVEIMGYREIVKNPICLRDMTEKAAAGKYSSISDLDADLQLMLSNCFLFNKGNRIYMKYGQTYKKDSKSIIEKAEKEEKERNSLKNDEKFMTELLNGVLSDYSGFVGKDTAMMTSSTASTSRRNYSRRRQPSEDVEYVEPEVKMEVEELPSVPTPARKGRKRAVPEDSDDIVATPKPPPRNPRKPESSLFSSMPSTSSATASGATATSSTSLRQTRLTSFFGATPKLPVQKKEPLSTQQQQQQPQVTFGALPDKNGTPRSLFDIPSTSASNLFQSVPPSYPPSARPSTRSTTSSTPTVTQKSAFRMSSATLQSPLPVPKKMTTRRLLDSDDDDDDPEAEIVIQPAPQSLSPEELKKEKLRSAENEAMSKFAHNQLVIVDGRAAKVIDSHLAHLSDIHREQRQSMMKKRREVLSEIPQSAVIYVEFFQKSNNLENFQWVTPDKVELLDLNSIGQKSPKIPGLKAAREWHQKVINGEDV